MAPEDWHRANFSRKRFIDDLNKPWSSSSSSSSQQSDLGVKHIPVLSPPQLFPQSGCNSGSGIIGHCVFQLFRTLKRFMSPSWIANYEDRTTQGILERSQVESRTRLRTHRKRVPDPKWHAFAIYSRPIVNGVEVHNTFTPSPTPYRNIDLKDITLEEVFPSLRSPNGGEHPEMWVRGLHHPALPPPPVGWDLPREGEPLAFPWECELNPLLEHVVFGPAPLYWHMGHPARLIMFGGEDTAAAPLFDTDYAQPATKPLLTHMYINAIADQDSFPWPIMVANTRGIRCRDIFDAISLNFQQFILQSEYDDWDETRRKHCLVEYDARGGPLTNDGVRRLDYLGGRVWFRGLAPNPNREGWVLFVGLA